MTRTKRTLGLLALGAGAAAIVPQVASAHTVSVACTGNQVTATGSLFPVSPPVTSAELTIDGVAQAPVQVPSIPGPSPVFTFPGQLYGDHVLVVSFVNGGVWTSPATPVSCGPPPQQRQPEQTPETKVPEPVVMTCKDYLARFPKAGPKRRAEWGCPVVKRTPKVKPPKTRVKLTCEDLKARGAGRGWYVRLGIPFYACNVPTPKRVDPPVAG